MSFSISDATSEEDLAAVRGLIRDYIAQMALDLSFQGIDEELAGLPGLYAPPRGALLVARDDATGAVLGSIALRPLPGPGDCEVKRLHVSPEARGRSIGQHLGDAILDRAEALGYRRVLLETVERMKAAVRIYHSFGFREVPPYFPNPVPGTRYMAVDLADRVRFAPRGG